MVHEAQLQPTASGGMFFVIITDQCNMLISEPIVGGRQY